MKKRTKIKTVKYSFEDWTDFNEAALHPGNSSMDSTSFHVLETPLLVKKSNICNGKLVSAWNSLIFAKGSNDVAFNNPPIPPICELCKAVKFIHRKNVRLVISVIKVKARNYLPYEQPFEFRSELLKKPQQARFCCSKSKTALVPLL